MLSKLISLQSLYSIDLNITAYFIKNYDCKSHLARKSIDGYLVTEKETEDRILNLKHEKF